MCQPKPGLSLRSVAVLPVVVVAMPIAGHVLAILLCVVIGAGLAASAAGIAYLCYALWRPCWAAAPRSRTRRGRTGPWATA
jgi:hypothetical protein